MVHDGFRCRVSRCEPQEGFFKLPDEENDESHALCVLASGKEIHSKGIIEVEAGIDDETHIIPFEDLPVECPIISIRKIVKKKNVVTFRDGGGYILNTVTRKKLSFVERIGVYSIELKILEPSEKKASGFARPGPWKPTRLSVQ